MNILLIGMNHTTAPLEIRERLSFSCGDERSRFPLVRMSEIADINEVLYLGTCNRVEVLVHSSDVEGALDNLKGFILDHGNLPVEEMVRCLYVYTGVDAVRHLFRVASSLDSMVIGEPQILGQLKDAYRQAVENNTTGVILNKVLHHAFRVAKRVRTETGIAGHAVSVSFTAVQLAKKIFGSLEGKTIMLVGTGEMSELAARNLINHGVKNILITNRTYARAQKMAEEFQGIPVAFEKLVERLADVDIVISSTGAPGYIITPDMIGATLRRRKNRLLFLIDIAVPRDIDPAAGKIDNVYLYNIDDLQDIVDENREIRKREAEKANAIIEEEVLKHQSWINTLAVVPTIVSLREKAEGIIKGEMEKSSSWMLSLSGEERKRVEILAASIVNKILHDPITGLKEESQDDDALPYIAAIRRLFRLDE